jgi:nicotinamidase-related amidase
MDTNHRILALGDEITATPRRHNEQTQRAEEHDMSEALRPDTALIVIDVQAAFEHPSWGKRNNPDADAHIESLVTAFGDAGLPVVFVRHQSAKVWSLFHSDSPGYRFKGYLNSASPDLLVTKTVHSSFHGTPDLHAWLSASSIGSVVIAGITTNHCCETTARVAGDLGYDVLFALDATHTFDRPGFDGVVVSADHLAHATATNLHEEFATVVSTEHVLEGLRGVNEWAMGEALDA